MTEKPSPQSHKQPAQKPEHTDPAILEEGYKMLVDSLKPKKRPRKPSTKISKTQAPKSPNN